MSGERPDLLVIEADSTGTVASFVRTLDELPRELRWVLVGGFAVNLRISTLHRLTGDVDTLTSAHREFLELLVGREDVERLAAAKVLVGSDPSVKVDVMASTIGEELPIQNDSRAFALARRWAYEQATTASVTAVNRDGRPAATCVLELATVPSLVALKVAALRGRQGRTSKTKVGSDIHDLVRMMDGRRIDELAMLFEAAPPELAAYVANQLVHFFHPDHDGRLSLGKLHTLTGRNVDALAVTLDQIALLAELGLGISSLLS